MKSVTLTAYTVSNPQPEPNQPRPSHACAQEPDLHDTGGTDRPVSHAAGIKAQFSARPKGRGGEGRGGEGLGGEGKGWEVRGGRGATITPAPFETTVPPMFEFQFCLVLMLFLLI
ncbi:hypothetical protein Pcinc_034899 [Petrolisthes cinctipes]|uniref:Uncharacterized protein n=1 Tax=Petrolisthes cinctipes TaxID=88211 RepID=A0AAE1ENG6_PETCI|nr:hypothetical protein Pcinc_034899 [Petrolisthes cinctipes]